MFNFHGLMDPKLVSFLRDQIQNMYDRPVDHRLSLMFLGHEDWEAEERYWSLCYATECPELIDYGGES